MGAPKEKEYRSSNTLFLLVFYINTNREFYLPWKIPVGSQGRLKEFDGVSADSSVVVQIINHGGYTSGGKLSSAKIKNTYADCYFLNLTHAKRKILAITKQEFFSIFKDKRQGFLDDIEVFFIELKEMAKKVIKSASDEMAKE